MGRLRAHACRPLVPDREQPLRLGLRVRARAVHERPADLPRAREAARRLVLDQRDDLPAGEPDGLRAVGRAAGPRALGLRALPAVLQADGDLRRGGGRVARGRGAARRGARSGVEPALPGLLRGRAAGGLHADRRRQRRAAGGLRAVRSEHQPRPAPERGARLPAPGVGAVESRRPLPRARHTRRLRRHARGRGGGRARWRDGGGPGGRGDPLRRRDQLTAAAAALGRRQRRRAARGRRRRRPRPARGRREPAGPPRGLRPARVDAAGLGGAGDEVAQPALGRIPLARLPLGTRRDESLRGRGLRPLERRGDAPEPHVPLPSRSPSATTGRSPRAATATRCTSARCSRTPSAR